MPNGVFQCIVKVSALHIDDYIQGKPLTYMKHTPELIVMLTHNDVTVPDAAAVFARCQHTHARYWGFKEEGLPFAEMQALFAR